MILVLSALALLGLLARVFIVQKKLRQMATTEPTMFLQPVLTNSKLKKGKSASNAGHRRVRFQTEQKIEKIEKQKLQIQILDEIFTCLLNGLVDGCYDEVNFLLLFIMLVTNIV